MSRTRVAMLVAVAVAAVTAIATGSSARGSPSGSFTGGTYRVGWERGWASPFEWSDGLDPTGEQADYGILSNLLVRTLVGYDHVAGAAGTKIVPDLAVAVPHPTNGGRTYVFRLKRGIRFGPPVDREITSADIRYAIERLARPANEPVGLTYYGHKVPSLVPADFFAVVRGFAAYRSGRAKTISGIRTPNAKSIVFDLIRPTGDFLDRLALPSAGPIPREVARCFEGDPGRYGGDLIASGPYMIDGADAVRLGSCKRITPMRGFTAARLTLVRNPRYDPATDSTAARENNPDRFVFVVDTVTQRGNALAIVKRLAGGELDDAYLRSTKLLRTSATAAAKRGLLRVSASDWLLYFSMNLTHPPFDDVHVRRAMNWVIDKANARADGFGGPLGGSIAQHIIPDGVLGDRLRQFAPFKTPDDGGDLTRAKAEMAKSKYATHSGVCVAPVCKRIHMSFAPEGPITYGPGIMVPRFVAEAARIGITFVNGGNASLYPELPSNNQPFTAMIYTSPSYPDPSAYVDPLLSQRGIHAFGNFDYALVGITPVQARSFGVHGRVTNVPSVDAALSRCGALSGAARLDCYAALDRTLMTDVVPWIPLLWRNRINILGPQVAKWGFDQSTGMTGFAHVAVRR